MEHTQFVVVYSASRNACPSRIDSTRQLSFEAYNTYGSGATPWWVLMPYMNEWAMWYIRILYQRSKDIKIKPQHSTTVQQCGQLALISVKQFTLQASSTQVAALALVCTYRPTVWGQAKHDIQSSSTSSTWWLHATAATRACRCSLTIGPHSNSYRISAIVTLVTLHDCDDSSTQVIKPIPLIYIYMDSK